MTLVSLNFSCKFTSFPYESLSLRRLTSGSGCWYSSFGGSTGICSPCFNDERRRLTGGGRGLAGTGEGVVASLLTTGVGATSVAAAKDTFLVGGEFGGGVVLIGVVSTAQS